MASTPQIAPSEWQDPVVQELHAIREKLVDTYQGNLHAYTEAARAHALALGFQFKRIDVQGSTPV